MIRQFEQRIKKRNKNEKNSPLKKIDNLKEGESKEIIYNKYEFNYW